MVNGKCPHCGSSEVYVSNNPFHDTFLVRTEAGPSVFDIHCYLCLNCRALQMHAAERSPNLFGKSQLLVEEVPRSANWKKVS